MTEEEIRKENEKYFRQDGRDKIAQLQKDESALPVDRNISSPSPFVQQSGVQGKQIADLVGPGEIMALRKPEKGSHKGQNGKLLIIGGSTLFHGASLWALKAASRICDMVFYASVPENLEIAKKMKGEVLDYIAIPRMEIESYIGEADTVLIGPGMVRPKDGFEDCGLSLEFSRDKRIASLNELNKIKDEGEQTVAIVDYLLHKYPGKQWVIDAGALQVMQLGWIPENAILTPHNREFEMLLKRHSKSASWRTKNPKRSFAGAQDDNGSQDDNLAVKELAKTYGCLIVLKGERDAITDGVQMKYAVGGNPGMTKGGTGDVLAGVIAGFACKNDPYLAAKAGSFLNKLAGDMLYKKVNSMFNATDLVEMIPEAYKFVLEY